MILSDIVKIKPGQPFKYKGMPATIVWTENVTEEVGVFDNEMKYARHLAFYFKYINAEGVEKDITHRSCWPHPDKLELRDYSR